MVNAPPSHCEKFNPDDVIVYTSTFYPDTEEGNIRSKLCIKFLENAERLGVRCVVSDGGSKNEEFLEKLHSFESVTVVESNEGMGEDRRVALKKAMEINSGNKYFLWSEPEKDDLITQENLSLLIQGADKGEYDVIVPKRLGESQLPRFQKWTETRANKRISQAMREAGVYGKESEDLDLWFGPKLFTHKGAQYFADYSSDLDKWDAIIKPVYDAAKNGIKIGSIGVNYTYDQTQSENESDQNNRAIREKRVQQYRLIIREILGEKTKTI